MELIQPPPESETAPKPQIPLPDMTGINVLQVVPRLDSGGVERGTVEIAEAIVRAGGTAWVASAGGRMLDDLQRIGAGHIAMPLDTKNPLKIWLNQYKLRDFIEAENIHIVHARSRAPAWSAKWAAQKLGVPFVTTYHGLYSEDFPLKRFYNKVMASGDRVIAISSMVEEHVRNIYQLPSEQMRLIYRGASLEEFDPDAEDIVDRAEILAQRWQVPDGEHRPFLILLPARMTRWKGHVVMLQAIKNLKRPLLLLLVGKGDLEYQQELVHLSHQLGPQADVHFVGDCADMPAAYTLSDLVVTPSQRPEAFGRTVVEAQAMRRLVIACDHGGARETIVNGVTGWLVPPGDATALTNAIRMAMDLPGEQDQMMRDQARRVVEEKFSVRRMQADTLAVYRELVPEIVAMQFRPEPEPEGLA